MKLAELLKKHKVEEGDIVSVKENGAIYEGTVLPSTDPNFLALKLDNGYNVGLKVASIKEMKKLKEGKKTCAISKKEHNRTTRNKRINKRSKTKTSSRSQTSSCSKGSAH